MIHSKRHSANSFWRFNNNEQRGKRTVSSKTARAVGGKRNQKRKLEIKTFLGREKKSKENQENKEGVCFEKAMINSSTCYRQGT